MSKIDKIDRRILSILQVDGRIANNELAERVGLSPTATSDRMRRLQKDGYILGFGARLDPHRLGLGLLVFVEVLLDKTTPDVFDNFARAVRRAPEVLECHMVAGGLRLSDQDPTCGYGHLPSVPRGSSAVLPGGERNADLCGDGRGQERWPAAALNEQSSRHLSAAGGRAGEDPSLRLRRSHYTSSSDSFSGLRPRPAPSSPSRPGRNRERPSSCRKSRNRSDPSPRSRP